ncbi:hypothetical protein JK635_02160 [Neobacillus sp. YIM B02564]|uniref:Uncharacterized protein n=1 Tax=Neobacillus paridis TaxID=2803862 RepID=A0ABS1TKJ5_9BACI|nr:hypothetical protein [Neobacillus paridis]MBL4951043.1 hypothetical protein [Neobacillus paridis]
MDLAEQKIINAIDSCQRALDHLYEGNKRLALGDLDFLQDKIIAAKWTLIHQIQEEEGEI